MCTLSEQAAVVDGVVADGAVWAMLAIGTDAAGADAEWVEMAEAEAEMEMVGVCLQHLSYLQGTRTLFL